MQPGMMPTESVRAAGHDDPRSASVLSEVRSRIGEQRFALWFAERVRVTLEGDAALIAVGSPFLLNCMQNQFREELSAAVRVVLGASGRVVFSVDATLATKPVPGIVSAVTGRADIAQTPHQSQTGTRSGHSSVASRATHPTRESGDGAGSNRNISSDVAGAHVLAAATRQRRLSDFAEFVASPSTEFALTACRTIAGAPGAQFNPLFLHGSVGTGKTHLLEAMCRQLRRTHAHLQVALLTAEGFANYFTQALSDRTLPSFRSKFRGVDVLLIDDVDFFESKRVFQEEFLHTMGDLIHHGRQVVVTGDRHPRLMTKLGDDLVSRFQSGLVCRLDTPDAETRYKIVVSKAQRLEGEFAPEALQYIAERFTGSVRELEGALNCLQTCHAMTGQRVTQVMARQMLADLERDCLRIVRLADIERVVCNVFGIKPKELKSESRVRTLAQPRMLAMFLARKHTHSAYHEIGQHFGGRNHSTVMSAERKVQEWLQENAQVRVSSQAWSIHEIVSTLEQQLLAG